MRLLDTLDRLLAESSVVGGTQPNPSGPQPSRVGEQFKPKEATPISAEELHELNQKAKRWIQQATFYVTKVIPVVGFYLSEMTICLTYSLPTMAVDDRQNIYINPLFLKEINAEEAVAVLVHEALHIMNETHYRQMGRNPQVWNIATDYIMNWYIRADEFKLPDGVLLPDENGDVHIQCGMTGQTFTYNIKGRTAEWLYAQIARDTKIPPPPPPPPGGDPPPPPPPWNPRIGDPVYNKSTKQYGQIEGFDDKGNPLCRKITREQAKEIAKRLKGQAI